MVSAPRLSRLSPGQATSQREKGNTWKELLFFRKFSTGTNRSIWILLGITVFSMQMVSAPRLSRLSPGQATSKREKGNTWKELHFFRKFSTGMNRSIWILLGITVFSIQMVSAPRLSRLSPGQATSQPACHSLWRHATLLLAVWRQKNPVKILVYLIVRITHTMERILQPKLCIWLLCLFKKFTIFSSLILPVNKHRLYLEYWKSTHNRLGIKFRFS